MGHLRVAGTIKASRTHLKIEESPKNLEPRAETILPNLQRKQGPTSSLYHPSGAIRLWHPVSQGKLLIMKVSDFLALSHVFLALNKTVEDTKLIRLLLPDPNTLS
jgi:hypothetical protein